MPLLLISKTAWRYSDWVVDHVGQLSQTFFVFFVLLLFSPRPEAFSVSTPESLRVRRHDKHL